MKVKVSLLINLCQSVRGLCKLIQLWTFAFQQREALKQTEIEKVTRRKRGIPHLEIIFPKRTRKQKKRQKENFSSLRDVLSSLNMAIIKKPKEIKMLTTYKIRESKNWREEI